MQFTTLVSLVAFGASYSLACMTAYGTGITSSIWHAQVWDDGVRKCESTPGYSDGSYMHFYCGLLGAKDGVSFTVNRRTLRGIYYHNGIEMPDFPIHVHGDGWYATEWC